MVVEIRKTMRGRRARSTSRVSTLCMYMAKFPRKVRVLWGGGRRGQVNLSNGIQRWIKARSLPGLYVEVGPEVGFNLPTATVSTLFE